jgi:hypothetical protein
MWKIILKKCWYFILIAAVIAPGGCSSPGSEYSRLVKKELAKGTRSDSLFMGIYLGMSSKEFYGHCWDLNKKGLFTNGSLNTTVLYKIPTALRFPASMNFYPDFYEDKIFRMRVSFEYDGWAPWNRNRYADSLLPDVLQLYKKWYREGNDFIKIADKIRGVIYVKVDGNRRITIGRFDDQLVKVDYSDLLVEEKLKLKK